VRYQLRHIPFARCIRPEYTGSNLGRLFVGLSESAHPTTLRR
jgi:hypothetical protein